MQGKLSAFVITYNRASLLETCLRAVSFADELIVVDKSSTDNSAEIAARYADRIEIVPWSPTVEDTRAFASSLCQHEWILFLDDDEILSAETGPYVKGNLAGCDADILAIPLRHYILGTHDERAYYWPEEHHRLFRRGAIEFIPTVHGGVALQSDRIASIPASSGVCIHHLSYQDVASWIERTNRYTSRPERIQVAGDDGNLIRFAHDRIAHWVLRTDDSSFNDYPTAVALLRAIYDMVDRLKAWETDRGVDGAELFRIAQENLVPAIDRRKHGAGISSREIRGTWEPRDSGTRPLQAEETFPTREPTEPASPRISFKDDRHMAMQATLVQLRATEAKLRERIEAERKNSLSLTSTRNELSETIAALTVTRDTLEQTRTTLTETRATLEQALATLAQTQTDLTEVKLDFELLSGSARLFIRQYLPKLRHHLLRYLA